MENIMKKIIFVFLSYMAGNLFAQSTYLPFQIGESLPDSCNPSDASQALFYKTTTNIFGDIGCYECTANNTYRKIGWMSYGEKWQAALDFTNKAGDLVIATGPLQDSENTNDNGVNYYQFSASASNYLIIDFGPMPMDWDRTTRPKVRVYSYSTSSHASNVAKWTVQTKYVRSGIEVWTGAFGLASSVNRAYTVANQEEIFTCDNFPAGQNGADAKFVVLLYRQGADVADTFAGTTRVTWVGMQYKRSSVEAIYNAW
jgi:hypothetical protein